MFFPQGKRLHTHDYKEPRGYEDKRVLVIGIGNSAGDAAVELARCAKQVRTDILRLLLLEHHMYICVNRVMCIPLHVVPITRCLRFGVSANQRSEEEAEKGGDCLIAIAHRSAKLRCAKIKMVAQKRIHNVN